MKKNMSIDKKKNSSGSYSEEETHNEDYVKNVNGKKKDAKLPMTFSFYLLILFVSCFILLPLLGRIKMKLGKPLSITSFTIPEPTPQLPTCQPETITQTCPENPKLAITMETDNEQPPTPTCPGYFRWIYEDLKPWKETGIMWEAVQAAKKFAYFRLVILEGKLYVESYKKFVHSRDEFTIWGIFQLLRMYPGKIPDLELMFECADHPKVRKESNATQIPALFHYCADEFTYDIPFPDWSFWGWAAINVKPWEHLMEDLKKGNEKVKWADRLPFAFWKGTIKFGRRRKLIRCNSTKDWNAQILVENWKDEARQGFSQSNFANQCIHRYKIYMEGRAWSVSEKYIQACDSMLLAVTPQYYEFFTRSLVPLKHFWPINPWKVCESIKFAVDWGQNHPEKAQEIGKRGSQFIMEELKMNNIYDYMYHLLSEYAKLLRYKPTVGSAAEVCLDTVICNAHGREKQYKIESMVKAPSQTGPCTMPQPYSPDQLNKFLSYKKRILENVVNLEVSGDILNTIDK